MRPAEFFAKLPTELWLQIYSYLHEVEYMCLISCSKDLNRKENWRDLTPASRETLLYFYDRDLDACKICVVCKKGHREGQSHSPKMATQRCRNLCSASCSTAIRLTNTHMLCRLCMEDISKNGTTRFRYTWTERWEHTCELDWRGDVLLLKVSSQFSWTGRHAQNVPHWDLRGGHRFLDRCNWCECENRVYGRLVKGIASKMRGYFADYKDEPTTWRDLIKCGVQCNVCTAYYTIGLRESGPRSTVTVTRFHDSTIRRRPSSERPIHISKTTTLSRYDAFIKMLSMPEVGTVMYFFHRYCGAMVQPRSRRLLRVCGANVVIEKTLDWAFGGNLFFQANS